MLFDYLHDLYNLGTRQESRQNYEKEFIVIETDYLPPNVLGMTDARGTIWIRKLYGYMKERVLKHEIFHNLFPYLPEYAIRQMQDGHLNLARFKFNWVRGSF